MPINGQYKNIESQKNQYVRILTEKRKLYKCDTWLHLRSWQINLLCKPFVVCFLGNMEFKEQWRETANSELLIYNTWTYIALITDVKFL